MNRSNSKHKYQSSSYGLSITLQLPSKTIVFKVPMPCPAPTLKEMLLIETQKANCKPAYFQTTNQDWLTDYKIQCGSGWIRANCDLRCVIRKKNSQAPTGMEAYSVLKCIGVGGFSKVYLTRDRMDGTFFGAKFIEKQKIKDKIQLIQNQRQINDSIAFPFLANMKQFIETEQYYIMILEYCPGGELFNLQRRVIRFEEEQAKKYFIQVLLAIQYLHEKGIIYRDLKPENVLLDVKGHIKIADFGLAKETREKRYSFCGSLEYMSPEILTRVGHSFEVDYYCLGALLFEMLVGCPPFYEPNSPQNDTKARILYQQVEFPHDLQLSDAVKDLIQKLLVKDVKKRMGHLGGPKEIKCHPWIGWINRPEWLSRSVEMPYPVNLDDFNFDCKDITVSANRMLTHINAQFKHKKRQVSKAKSSYLRKSQKILSPYRENRQSLSYLKKNMSTQKFNKKSTLESLSKSKKLNKSKSKQVLTNNLKACYLSGPKLDLKKFLRFPTEVSDPNKIKLKGLHRQSCQKRQSDMKQNYPTMKKRKTKEELVFIQAKRY